MSGGSFLDNLMGAYSGLRRSVIDPETGIGLVTSEPTGAVMQRSSVLPIGRDDSGRLVPAVPGFIADAPQAIASAVTLPRDAWRGDVETMPSRMSREEGQRVADLAGLAMTGSLPFRAPKGALRMFGGAAKEAADDPLAALQSGLAQATKDAPAAPPGPARVDPAASSWDLFHGSTSGPDFDRFDPTHGKARSHSERGALFLSPDPDAASFYAAGSGAGAEAGPRVFRTTVEPGRTRVFDVGEMIETDPAFGERARAALMAEREGTPTPADIARADSLRDAYRTDLLASRAQDRAINEQLGEMGLSPAPLTGASYGHGYLGAVIQMAKEQGLDTAVIRGLAEHGGGDQVIALTPGRVRSRYGGDLLYSTAPTALGAGAVAGAALAGSTEAKAAPSSERKPMPGFFDDVPMAAAAAAPPAGPSPSPGGASDARSGFFDDVPFASAGGTPTVGAARAGNAAPEPETGAGPSALADVVQGAGAGIIRGAGGLVDLPQNLWALAELGTGHAARLAANGLRRTFGEEPIPADAPLAQPPRLLPSPADLPRPGAAAISALEDATGKLYEPQTRAGKFARTAAEFVPGAGRKLGEVLALGIAPGLASEGAGQLTEGSALEPWARGGAAVGAGLGGAAVRARTGAEGMASRRAQGATPEQVDQAEALFREAAERGLPLTRANALDAITGGVTSLSDLQRVVEGTGRLRGFFAPTAEGVRREGEGVLDTIAPAGANPSVLGGELQDAARSAVAATPQGTALSQALDAAGPRVTPEQAGRVIQPELQRAYDRREGMRAALGEQDYRAAEAAPERIGIDRTVTVERPGEPIVTQARPSRPAFTEEAAPPLPPPPAAGAAGRPESILQYLSRNGGIPLDAEARAADLHRLYVPGGGTLARNGAPSWDDIRVRLTEGGFLPYDATGAASAGDVRDLVLGAIQRERIGRGRQVRLSDEGRPEARRGQESDEYRAALSEAERRLDTELTAAGVPLDSIHPDIRSRTLNALMRGETTDPLEAFERTVMATRENPAPFSKSTTVSEEVSAPRFGQANPQAVVDHIDEALRSAKGPVARALEAARGTLFARPERGAAPELDLSVAGLHGARGAITDMLAKAEPTAQRALMGVRDRLDRALGTVPEYEAARSGFEAASRNLDPFASGTVPGRIANRDQVSGRSTMPPEQAPAAIAEGPSGARDFNAVASPEARRQMEGQLTTQILDGIGGQPGAASAQTIRDLLRQREDVFEQFPVVRDRLRAVAAAHDGLEVVNRSPLGKIANRPDAQAAIEALFPTGAKGVSTAEVRDGVRGLARFSPRAAEDAVRMHVEQVFRGATERLQSGANQAGGPKFSQALVGHSGEAASVEAAISALPNGETTWKGVRRLLDIFDAQGKRQAIGSGTSFNDTLIADMKAGKPLAKVGTGIATGGINLPRQIKDRIEAWRLGEGLDDLARLFTDPKMASTFRRLATEPGGSAGLPRLVSMVVDRAARGYGSAQRPEPAAEPKREPLKLSVKPIPQGR